MTLQQIPLNQLQRSARNVRKTGGTDITDLVASIAAHGVLQNLSVLPAGDGQFEVVAGARRLAALARLARDQRIPIDHPVPCMIMSDATANEASLAENAVREAMHPADQFEAFSLLVDNGMSVGDIAARFGVTELVVRQRLKLAHVAPTLIEVYRKAGMTLEQLMAFTVSNDMPAQERYWSRAQRWEREPAKIKEALTKGEIDATRDPRALLVGVAAYEAAGGGVRYDLFGGPNAGFLRDSALLTRLCKEELEMAAEKVRHEGWSWVEARSEFDWSAEDKFGHIEGKRITATPEQQKELKKLRKALDAARKDDGSEEDELEIQDRIDQLADRVEFTSAQKAASGAVVTLDQCRGVVRVVRGLVRHEDRAAARKADPSLGRVKEPKKQSKPKGLSDALALRLSAQRVAATRAELIKRPQVALAVVVHAFVLHTVYPPDTSYGESRNSALLVSLDRADADLRRSDDSIMKSTAWLTVDDAAKAWRQKLPPKRADLWSWLLVQKPDVLIELLAVAGALRLGGTQAAVDAATGQVQASHAVGDVVALDMAKWWKPTRDAYLGAVPKQKVIEALQEAGLKEDAHRLAGGKTGAVAAEAEQLLLKTGWLPKMLRTKAYAAAIAVPIKAQPKPNGATAQAKPRAKPKPTPKPPAKPKATAKPRAKA